mmetsp:Transcript_11914/g.29206  ORF Transcript_11914/g.29206 Transcript_11914/m.29206 type:complete len:312 (-) Transcript_11914:1101-2036(-)
MRPSSWMPASRRVLRPSTSTFMHCPATSWNASSCSPRSTLSASAGLMSLVSAVVRPSSVSRQNSAVCRRWHTTFSSSSFMRMYQSVPTSGGEAYVVPAAVRGRRASSAAAYALSTCWNTWVSCSSGVPRLIILTQRVSDARILRKILLAEGRMRASTSSSLGRHPCSPSSRSTPSRYAPSSFSSSATYRCSAPSNASLTAPSNTRRTLSCSRRMRSPLSAARRASSTFMRWRKRSSRLRASLALTSSLAPAPPSPPSPPSSSRSPEPPPNAAAMSFSNLLVATTALIRGEMSARSPDVGPSASSSLRMRFR